MFAFGWSGIALLVSYSEQLQGYIWCSVPQMEMDPIVVELIESSHLHESIDAILFQLSVMVITEILSKETDEIYRPHMFFTSQIITLIYSKKPLSYLKHKTNLIYYLFTYLILFSK